MTDNVLDLNPEVTDPTFDSTKDYLKELVGEGKKFKTVEDLAKGKQESDIFISSITKENKEIRAEYQKLRDELQSRANLADLVDKLEKIKEASVSNDDSKDIVNETGTPGVKPEDIERLVSSQVNNIKTQEKREANLNLVRNKLQERFGTNYSTKELASRIGVDEDYFVQTAANHPQMLIKTLGLDAPKGEQFQSPPASSRQLGFKPDSTERTEAYYKKLAAEKGVNIYLDRDISLQMHKDAQRLGEKFFDAD